ncbi:NfeD family protein [Oculatella sp. LEGE 06141]|uniref:NfeD family protein n=1 Tax=Oculatella sp. LEGE 06141 TaxID=1828648 RepID=UPI0018823853|nr:NfeD family protein [Oculatella sp. LEGE 06141]MBE9180940.1 NfeD family protein [Oculatella sp. LEGE 06141]
MSNFFVPSEPEMLLDPVKGTISREITYGHCGRVKYAGTYWSARLYQPPRSVILLPGAPVTIVAVQDVITLLVIPSGLE